MAACLVLRGVVLNPEFDSVGTYIGIVSYQIEPKSQKSQSRSDKISPPQIKLQMSEFSVSWDAWWQPIYFIYFIYLFAAGPVTTIYSQRGGGRITGRAAGWIDGYGYPCQDPGWCDPYSAGTEDKLTPR